MEQRPDEFEQRLEQLARAWQSKRHTGPAPEFKPPQPAFPLAWAGACAAAVVLLFFAWPTAPEWPEELRPLVRSSTLEVAAPDAPSTTVGFRYPGRPARSFCFSQSDNCDQPAG